MRMRRTPTDNHETITVRYPASLFSLERDEVLIYERLAFTVGQLAGQVLQDYLVPIEISFSDENGDPFLPAASVVASFDQEDKKLRKLVFEFPLFAPVSLFCVAVLISKAGGITKESVARIVERALQAVAAARQANINDGKGSAIRSAFTFLDVHISEMQNWFPLYAAMAQFIASHEAAHAFSRHVFPAGASPEEKIGLEFVADALAAGAYFNFYVRTTPHEEWYRRQYSHRDYADSLRSNFATFHRTQIAVALSFALANSLARGNTDLKSFGFHPHYAARLFIQSLRYEYLAKCFEKEIGVTFTGGEGTSANESLLFLNGSKLLSQEDLEEAIDLRKHFGQMVAAISSGARPIALSGDLRHWIRHCSEMANGRMLE